MSGTRLKANRNISTTSINYTLSQNRTEFSHHVFMLVGYDFMVKRPEEWCFRACLIRMLNQNHCRRNLKRKIILANSIISVDLGMRKFYWIFCFVLVLCGTTTYQCTLTNKINRIEFNHWFKQCDCLTQTSTSTSDTQSHSSSITDVWIVWFSKQRYHRWTLFGSSENRNKKD